MVIAEYLRKNDLTQRAFADKLGCTTAFVNGLVNGKNTDIKISLLDRISKATSIPHEKLVRDLLRCKKSTSLKRK